MRYISKAIVSNVIKSTRRLLFTHCNATTEERGYYFADMVYGFGTGILVKYQHIFFLLTAKHVLDNHYDHAAPQNESPFLTFTFADKGIDNERDILRPIRAWRIGELIHSDTTAMDQDDLILIEFNVLFHGYPDKFIDLDKEKHTQGIPENKMYNGMFLIAAGYPENINGIDYFDEGMSNSKTTLQRKIIFGTCSFNHGHPVMSLYENLGHADLNGLSGGIISNLQPKSNKIEWIGVIQRAGNNIINFCPANLIIPAIKQYRMASHYIIDPVAQLLDTSKENTAEAVEFRKRFLELTRRSTVRDQKGL